VKRTTWWGRSVLRHVMLACESAQTIEMTSATGLVAVVRWFHRVSCQTEAPMFDGPLSPPVSSPKSHSLRKKLFVFFNSQFAMHRAIAKDGLVVVRIWKLDVEGGYRRCVYSGSHL
jgi:hypothetical protein